MRSPTVPVSGEGGWTLKLGAGRSEEARLSHPIEPFLDCIIVDNCPSYLISPRSRLCIPGRPLDVLSLAFIALTYPTMATILVLKLAEKLGTLRAYYAQGEEVAMSADSLH